MWDFSTRRAFAMIGQTLPFVLLRLAVYLAIAIGFVLVTGLGAGLGWGVGAIGGPDAQPAGAFWGGAIGFALTVGAVYFAREYLLYLVKAGHIAVMVELLDGEGAPPAGRAQIAHARAVVEQRFAEASALFALDQLVKSVLAAVTAIVQGVASVIPLPGAQQFVGLIRAFLRIAVGLIDEVILAYAIRARTGDPWVSARTALILYAQNYAVMLKNAAWLAVITYGLAFIVFLLMLAPAAALVWLVPGAWSAGGFVFAIVFAWAVKAALIEPFAIACLMQVYFKAIEGQTPDPVWEERLAAASDRFGALGARAQAPPS